MSHASVCTPQIYHFHTMSVQDGALAYHDNAHPPPNYDIFMISLPDHPFSPGAPVSQCLNVKTRLTIFLQITKRMFKDLHQLVFSIVILCAWTLVPAILKAEAGRHIKMVALKNTISGKLFKYIIIFKNVHVSACNRGSARKSSDTVLGC